MVLISKFHCQRKCLPNGLVLLVSENYRLPLLSLHAFVLAGSAQNPMESPGLASMTASLLDEGTERFSAHQIAALVEGTGGALSVFSHRELSGISLELKSEDLELGIDLLAEMLQRPTFPRERFELERQKVLNHLQSLDDNPQVVAGNLFNKLIYEGTPLQDPVPGTGKSVRSLDRDQVSEFHRHHFAPRNTYVVAVGAVGTDRISELVAQHFLGWENPDFSRREIPEIKRQSQPIFQERTVDKAQLNILVGNLGVTRNNPDYYALQVMDVILGSGPGFTSRIPRTLRDEQGLAYTTYADICSSSGLYPGRFIAYINTSPEHREQALQGLLAAIKSMVDEGVTEEEVKIAQDYLTGNFVFDFQSNAHLAQFLLGTELYGLGIDFLQEYPKLIRAVTPEDVHRVARCYLDTVNYTTVMVGPAN